MLRVEPTVVVAIAVALARVGAAIEVKLAETKLAVVPSSPPPQAVKKEVAAVAPRGSMGTPARNCSALRRVVSEDWDMS